MFHIKFTYLRIADVTEDFLFSTLVWLTQGDTHTLLRNSGCLAKTGPTLWTLCAEITSAHCSSWGQSCPVLFLSFTPPWSLSSEPSFLSRVYQQPHKVHTQYHCLLGKSDRGGRLDTFHPLSHERN